MTAESLRRELTTVIDRRYTSNSLFVFPDLGKLRIGSLPLAVLLFEDVNGSKRLVKVVAFVGSGHFYSPGHVSVVVAHHFNSGVTHRSRFADKGLVSDFFDVFVLRRHA